MYVADIKNLLKFETKYKCPAGNQIIYWYDFNPTRNHKILEYAGRNEIDSVSLYSIQ